MFSTPIQLKDRTVAVLGGDRRMCHAARCLSEAGATVRLLGHPDLPPSDPPVCLCRSLADAAREADALLLPLPVSRDGLTVHCPFAPDLVIPLEAVADLARARPALRLFGGRIPAGLADALAPLPAGDADPIPRVTDYAEDEAFLLRNAALTAEGALMLAMGHTDHALSGGSAAIVGYGRIGQLLARLLRAVGMEVTVCARRRERLLWAATDGCHPVRMGDETRAGGGLFPLCYGHPVIFNTVPEPVLGRDLLLRLEPETLLIDLASPPYGVRDEDAEEAARENGLSYLRAPGLPGRYAPRDAGYAIAACVADGLRRTPISPKGGTQP